MSTQIRNPLVALRKINLMTRPMEACTFRLSKMATTVLATPTPSRFLPSARPCPNCISWACRTRVWLSRFPRSLVTWGITSTAFKPRGKGRCPMTIRLIHGRVPTSSKATNSRQSLPLRRLLALKLLSLSRLPRKFLSRQKSTWKKLKLAIQLTQKLASWCLVAHRRTEFVQLPNLIAGTSRMMKQLPRAQSRSLRRNVN